jgi:hypothetical protein
MTQWRKATDDTMEKGRGRRRENDVVDIEEKIHHVSAVLVDEQR